MQQLRRDQEELRSLKLLELQEQQKFLRNCKALVKLQVQKKKDFAMDGLIQLNETLRALSNDIEGFKSIRHRLFLKASSEKDPADRLYLYLFHLFESLVSNIAVLTQKTT